MFEDDGVTAILTAPPTDLPPLGRTGSVPDAPVLVGVPVGAGGTPGRAVPPAKQGRQPHQESSLPGLPVLPQLADLFPSGSLRRGATVAVTSGSWLLLALLAQASRTGSWCAVVGWPDLGGLAAAELGVALDRLVAVPEPGPQWLDVTAALLDGADIVVARPPPRTESRDLRRLTARARQRRSVLLAAGEWPGAELRLSIVDSTWSGLEHGAGHLTARQLTVRAEGRGAASRPREARIEFPYGIASDQTASEAVA
jgi:hypothetical protein